MRKRSGMLQWKTANITELNKDPKKFIEMLNDIGMEVHIAENKQEELEDPNFSSRLQYSRKKVKQYQ